MNYFKAFVFVYLIAASSVFAQRQDIGVRGGGGGGSGDVTAAAVFATDNVLIRSDGTGKGVQFTGVTVDDANNCWGLLNFTNALLVNTNQLNIGWSETRGNTTNIGTTRLGGLVTASNGITSILWIWNQGTQTNDGAAFFTANLSATKGVFISGSGSDVFDINNLAFFTNVVTIYSNLLVGGSGTFSNGISSVGTNNGAFRASGTNTGFGEHTVLASGASNSYVWSLAGNATVGQVVGIYLNNTQAGSNQMILTNITVSGGNTFNANQFDSSGTIDLLSGALVTNLVHFGTFTFNSAVGLDITATNLSKFGSIDVRTQLNVGAVTVSNSFQGLGSGINGIDSLISTNWFKVGGPQTNTSTLQIAGGGSSSNAWVGGMFYVLNQGFTNRIGDAALTNSASVIVPGHMLTNLYDQVEIITGGSAQAATATTNQIKLLYGSETICDTGLLGLSNSAWRASILITRTGNSNELCYATIWGATPTGVTNFNIGLLQTNGINTTFQVQLASRKPGGITNDFIQAIFNASPR